MNTFPKTSCNINRAKAISSRLLFPELGFNKHPQARALNTLLQCLTNLARVSFCDSSLFPSPNLREIDIHTAVWQQFYGLTMLSVKRFPLCLYPLTVSTRHSKVLHGKTEWGRALVQWAFFPIFYKFFCLTELKSGQM